jgi:hypothetical protein
MRVIKRILTTAATSNLKSRTIRRGVHARINGDMKSAYVWSENLKVKKHYEDLGLGGRTPKQVSERV